MTDLDEKLISIEISEPYFSFIKNGTKKVEGRKISPKWKNLKIGNKMLITCNTFKTNNNKIVESFQPKIPFFVKIKNIRYYHHSSCGIQDPLTEYLIKEGLDKVLPGIKTLSDGRNIYLQWSTLEEINKYGMMAIEIEYIEDFAIW